MPRFVAVLVGVALIGVALGAQPARANDLLRLYQLAQMQDTTLQSARDQRDAAIEARPQALSQWLPQLRGTAAAERERLGEQTGLTVSPSGGATPVGISALPGCALATDELTERCNINYQTYGLTLSQTLWSFTAFNQLKEADSAAAGAEASYRSAQQQLVERQARWEQDNASKLALMAEAKLRAQEEASYRALLERMHLAQCTIRFYWRVYWRARKKELKKLKRKKMARIRAQKKAEKNRPPTFGASKKTAAAKSDDAADFLKQDMTE